MQPIFTGLAGALGLTCTNGMGAFGAFVIGAGDGAAFGAASTFVQVGLTTGDLTQAINAAETGALVGGFLGGAISVGLNELSPFVCFAAGTEVDLVEEAISDCARPGASLAGPRAVVNEAVPFDSSRFRCVT
jgi:hypothetical protein